MDYYPKRKGNNLTREILLSSMDALLNGWATVLKAVDNFVPGELCPGKMIQHFNQNRVS